MSLEERILNIAEGPNWYDSRELRAIALEVRKMEDRIKQLEDRIKQMEEAGDALAYNHNPFTFIDWTKAKEAKL